MTGKNAARERSLFGAVFGIVIAYVAITLSVVTGEPVFDAAGSAAIGIRLLDGM